MFGPYEYIISVDFYEIKSGNQMNMIPIKIGVLHNRPQPMIGALTFIMLSSSASPSSHCG